MARQFARLHVRQDGDEFLIVGNRAGLENLKWMIQEALDDRHGGRDECGQSRYACKHGKDTIQVTVRNQDEFQKLPDCPACKGSGLVDIVGDGDPLDCQECGGYGKKVPNHVKKRLPFIT